MFGASRTATNRSRSPSPSKSTNDGWRISPIDLDTHRRRHVGERLAGAVVAIQLCRHVRAAGEADEEIGVAVAVEVAPRRGAGVGEVGDTGLGGDVDERAVVVAIQPVRLVLREADEEVEVAVAVVIGPGVGLAAGGGEQFGLHLLESHGWLSRQGGAAQQEGGGRPMTIED